MKSKTNNEDNSTDLSKKERAWIIEQIRCHLDSTNDSTECGREEWERRDKVLRKGITEISWNWEYDMSNDEMKLMKRLWEKLK